MDDSVLLGIPLSLKVGPTSLTSIIKCSQPAADTAEQELLSAAVQWASLVLTEYEYRDLLDLCLALDFADPETIESDFHVPPTYITTFTPEQRSLIGEQLVALLGAVANEKIQAFYSKSENTLEHGDPIAAGVKNNESAEAGWGIPDISEEDALKLKSKAFESAMVAVNEAIQLVRAKSKGLLNEELTPENFAPPTKIVIRHGGPEAEVAGRISVLDSAVASNAIASMNPMSESAAHQRDLINRLAKHAGDFRAAKDVSPLSDLRASFPHFAKVIDFVEEQIALGKLRGPLVPMRMAPMLLTGDPGLGKTKFAKELAKKFAVPFCFTDISTATTGSLLSGSYPYWKGAKQGAIADALLNHDLVNLVFLVDELDKARGGNEHNAAAAFHTLLEPETAGTFVDEFLGVPLNTRHFSWIFTSNGTATISEPLLSRMRVFEIRKPTPAEMSIIVQSLYKSALGTELATVFAAELPPSTVDELTKTGYSPREALALITDGLGKAAVAGRIEVLAEDIIAATDDLGAKQESRPIGFWP